ncbi:MAG: hypothetical protein SYC29_16595 [Planctomycetota bacterium]|nr:hypothetical protein [Planctomycetota bacterium]
MLRLKRRQYTRRDDRGRAVVLCPYNEVPAALKLTGEELEAARAWHKRHRFPWREIWLFLVGLAAAIIILFLPHVNGVRLAPIWDWACAVIAIVIVIAMSPILTAALLRHTSNGVLAARRCPSCYHHLRLLPTEPDACTICPGCGAAWRLAEHRPDADEGAD